MSDSRPHVVALCGSLRPESRTRWALEETLVAVERAGGTGELVDLREYQLPMVNPNREREADVAELVSRIDAADSLVLGTPVYHGSYSSPLKMALEYCGFDEFEGKTVGLVAAAGGTASYASTLNHLRVVATTLRAWVVPHQVGIPRSDNAFDRNGALRGPVLRERVETLGQEVVESAPMNDDTNW